MSTKLSGQVIREHIATLSESIVTQQYKLQSEVWESFDPAGHAKSVRDTGYHLTYLAEALEAEDPALFSEYVAWVKVLFAGLKFGDEVLSTTLQLIRQALIETLPAEHAQPAVEYLDIGLNRLATAPLVPESFICPAEPLSDLARRYLDMLLDGDRHAASHLILHAVETGTDVKDIYLYVFQPAQREIGRLWQTSQISVAQEHFCTAATQLIMSQLYRYIFTGEHKERRMVVCCVGGELHEIGARMVADFFEMSGWDTYFLGANTPPESIARTVVQRQAHILALSTTMTFHVGKVAELIAKVKENNQFKTRILVGGYPFNLSPDLWRKIGADGYAPNAELALLEAERLMAE